MMSRLPDPTEHNSDRGEDPPDPHGHIPNANPIAGRHAPPLSPGTEVGLCRHAELERPGPASLSVAIPNRVGYQSGVLEYVASSLFESPAQTLMNTVNTVGVMGKGIANDFRRLYPDMFERYRAFCTNGKFVVGQLYLYRTPHKWVLNFPTKEHWRSPSRMEWIEAGLQKFTGTYSQYGITSIAFPQLGTGNGGLDWDNVRPLMEKYLRQVRIPVYIHVRPRDPKFVPEHLRAGDVPALSKELHAARVDVTFERFVHDMREAFHAQLKEPQDRRSFRASSCVFQTAPSS